MAESDLIRGNVDTVILKVLYEGDRYGYDLIKQINARSDGQWEIKQPTVYACLKRLEKQGFISSYWDSSESDGGRRKYYSLTESGKEVFLKYKNEFERATSLFGELISGTDSPVFIQTADDYSDVEEESYAVPKRRPRPRQKKSRQDIAAAPIAAIQEDQGSAAPDRSNEQNTASEVPRDIFELLNANETAEHSERVMQNEHTDADTAEQTLNDAPARAALDPRSIIEHYYAAETGESYSDAHKKIDIVETAPSVRYTAVQRQQPVPTERQSALSEERIVKPVPVAERPETSPVVTHKAEVPAQSEPTAPPAPTIYAAQEESDARREYKTVLEELVDKFEMAPPSMRSAAEEVPAVEQAATESAAETADGKLYKVERAVRELGNDVTVRTHNDSAKEYANKNYYYSNRLMITHYTAMCASMFIIGLALFLTFYMGLGMRMPYDYILYISAGLLPIAMFIVAVINFAGEPNQKKRINVNFKFSIIIRCIIMLQVAVIIYCLNLIWGMPVGFSVNYIPSLVIPCAYALFIPISQVIFMNLLKSGNYSEYTE